MLFLRPARHWGTIRLKFQRDDGMHQETLRHRQSRRPAGWPAAPIFRSGPLSSGRTGRPLAGMRNPIGTQPLDSSADKVSSLVGAHAFLPTVQSLAASSKRDRYHRSASTPRMRTARPMRTCGTAPLSRKRYAVERLMLYSSQKCLIVSNAAIFVASCCALAGRMRAAETARCSHTVLELHRSTMRPTPTRGKDVATTLSTPESPAVDKSVECFSRN